MSDGDCKPKTAFHRIVCSLAETDEWLGKLETPIARTIEQWVAEQLQSARTPEEVLERAEAVFAHTRHVALVATRIAALPKAPDGAVEWERLRVHVRTVFGPVCLDDLFSDAGEAVEILLGMFDGRGGVDG